MVGRADDLFDDVEDDDSVPVSDSVPPGADPRGSRRHRLERILPEIFKRAIERGVEAGIGTLSKTDDVLRGVVGDVKLPKEIVSYLFSTVDETKNGMLRVVAGEVRSFLEATDLSKELQKALTSLSFEIKTEIRFIPNDAGGVTADVQVGKTSVHRKPVASRRSRKVRGA